MDALGLEGRRLGLSSELKWLVPSKLDVTKANSYPEGPRNREIYRDVWGLHKGPRTQIIEL